MKTSAFTLIETLVAVTLLTFAVAGPVTAAHRGLVAASSAQERLTASFLAQEGIEYIRLLRDNQYLADYARSDTSQTWTSFQTKYAVKFCGQTAANSVGENNSGQYYCAVDPVAGTIAACTCKNATACAAVTTGGPKPNPLVCSPLSLSADGVYTQLAPGVASSGFIRRIQMSFINPQDEEVVSTVSWKSHGTQLQVSVSDHLTPWQ